MATFELMEKMAPNAVIKVVGVGGGGGNAVAHMVNSQVDGVEFITANTDSQAIKNCGAKLQLQLGSNVTKGLGAGANPEVGRQAALEDRERIMDALQGADMVFITAGMGGGTGTGAAPVVAQLAKEMGILTVAVVTKPFPFEGRRRMQVAMKGIEELSQHVDSLITIPNEKLIPVLGRHIEGFAGGHTHLQLAGDRRQGADGLLACGEHAVQRVTWANFFPDRVQWFGERSRIRAATGHKGFRDKPVAGQARFKTNRTCLADHRAVTAGIDLGRLPVMPMTQRNFLHPAL